MGTINKKLESFEPVRRHQLEKLLRSFPRRVDYNHDTVACAHNATTTIATLKCGANELEIGGGLRFVIAGTITNNAGNGNTATYTPTIKLNNTTIYADTSLAIDDTAGSEAQAFRIEGQIVWAAAATVYLTGLISVSAIDQTEPDTGNGALTATGVLNVPIYHTLTSQHVSSAHVLEVTLAISNQSGAVASKRVATLWAE